MVLECFLLLTLSVLLVRSLGIRILYEYYFMRKVLKLFRVVVWVLLLQLILFFCACVDFFLLIYICECIGVMLTFALLLFGQ